MRSNPLDPRKTPSPPLMRKKPTGPKAPMPPRKKDPTPPRRHRGGAGPDVVYKNKSSPPSNPRKKRPVKPVLPGAEGYMYGGTWVPNADRWHTP